MSNFNADEEEKNLELALKLSLQEFEEKSKLAANEPENSETRQVMALFDFEAVEENELTIRTGDIITITNDFNEYWYEGFNRNGEGGFFPSNFVTFDFHDTMPVSKLVTVEIDPSLMDKMMELIENSDPTKEHSTSEFSDCKKRTQVMEQMIEGEITAIDQQLSFLNDLSQNFYNLSLQYSEASKNEYRYNPNDVAYSTKFRPHTPYIKQSVPKSVNIYQNMSETANVYKNTSENTNMYQNKLEVGSFQRNVSDVDFLNQTRNPQAFQGVNLNPYYPSFNSQTALDLHGSLNPQNAHVFSTELPPLDPSLYGQNFDCYKQYNMEYVPPRNISDVDIGGYPVSSEINQPNIYPRDASYHQRSDFNQR